MGSVRRTIIRGKIKRQILESEGGKATWKRFNQAARRRLSMKEFLKALVGYKKAEQQKQEQLQEQHSKRSIFSKIMRAVTGKGRFQR